MTDQTPVAEAISRTGRVMDLKAGARILDWSEAERRLLSGGWRWLATVRPDGSPHVVPVFGAWSQRVVFLVSNPRSRKSHNLEADGRCVLTTEADGVHLVVEGQASRIRDRQTLSRASRAFDQVYGWPTTVSGDKLDAEYGAPTSGGPPYRVYQIAPRKAFGFPINADFVPTRWLFT